MATFRQLFRNKVILALFSLPLLAGRLSVEAQSFLRLRIGDSASGPAMPGNESFKPETYKSFIVRKWILSNSNELSITSSSAGKIVYLESDWNGEATDTGCDLPGLKFGATTLSDLRERFGSNGFGFDQRGTGMEIPGGFAMFNSYEVGSNVVTFITKVSRSDFQRLNETGKSAEIAHFARLDAISIADAGYAKEEWGERIYDPNYKNIIWK